MINAFLIAMACIVASASFFAWEVIQGNRKYDSLPSDEQWRRDKAENGPLPELHRDRRQTTQDSVLVTTLPTSN